MCYRGKIYKLFLLLVLFSVNLSAQTVINDIGYPVIDLSALTPLEAVLSSADAIARRQLMNEQTPSNLGSLKVGVSVSGGNGTWNAKMSVKFQVMRADHTVGPTDWATAYNQCKSYDEEGGGISQWRLPTQRELLMIWILHPQLVNVDGFTAFSAVFYWSVTEGDREVWNVPFDSGGVSHDGDKGYPCSFRCVRDIY